MTTAMTPKSTIITTITAAVGYIIVDGSYFKTLIIKADRILSRPENLMVKYTIRNGEYGLQNLAVIIAVTTRFPSAILASHEFPFQL